MRIVLGKKLEKIIEEKKADPNSLEEILTNTKDIQDNIKRLEKLALQKRGGILEISDSGVEPTNTVWQEMLRVNFCLDHEISCFGDKNFRLDATHNNGLYRLSVVAVNGNTFFISLHWATAAHRSIDMDYVSGKDLMLAVGEMISLFKKVEANK